MRLYIVLRYLGLVLIINGAVLLLCVAVAMMCGDTSVRPLVYSALVTLLFGVFPMVFVPAVTRISNSEGQVIVIGGWLLSCLFGTLPYILWGGEFSFTNAWFESVSGFTTTGSSILTAIEVLPHGLLFWRSATHWLGGLGIILFVLSVLPTMGVAGTVLYRTEMSNLAKDNFRQNARNALRILMAIYAGLTVAEVVFLLAAGMNLFDAVTHSFATIATGGFSPKNASIAYYKSIGIECVVLVFMILSGIHFGLLFSTIVKKRAIVWKVTAVRYYLAMLVIGAGLITFMTHGSLYATWFEAVRYSTFQVVSIGTSTGFANADSSIWPPLAQIILMLFALQCACVGSTSGGIKVDRFVLLVKAIGRQLKLLLHPHAVVSAWIDGKSVADDTLAAGVLYICLYLMVVLFGGFALTALGVDPLSAFSGAIATTGNVGPGLGKVGSVGNFAAIPVLGKWVLTATMLLGRLEIYGFIMIFLPRIWKARRATG